MMREFFLLFITCVTSALHCSNQLEYEQMLNDPYTDHVQHFKKLFQKINVNSIIEFGVGNGTKYLLDNCKSVTSCSVVLKNSTEDWMETEEWFNRTVDLFRIYQNWTPILKYATIHMEVANQTARRNSKDPALQDATYLLDIKDLCDELLQNKQYEMAFVDSGFHMRGDLVNELFDRVPIIVAHDTNNSPEIYGWNKIYTPSNYTKIVFQEGQGITFWVRQDRGDVILALGASPVATVKKMRIFFPITHDQLGKSILNSFKYLGHTLVVPGTSFSQVSKTQGPHISDYCLFCPKEMQKRPLFLQDDRVEVIENNEIFTNPPDVIFITWSIHELDIWNIYNEIRTGTKLVYFTGNENEKYQKPVSNFLVLGSIANYSFPNANVLAWIPWIDFSHLEYEKPAENNLSINSYLARHYTHPHLHKDSQLFNQYAQQIAKDKSIQINNYGGLPHDNAIKLIRDSQATLHIKSLEGFGYTVAESLSLGRPVFLKRSFTTSKPMMNWCIEGKTAIFFDSYDEFKTKLDQFATDATLRKQLQLSAASTIRRIVNNDQQARKLQYFLEHLK